MMGVEAVYKLVGWLRQEDKMVLTRLGGRYEKGETGLIPIYALIFLWILLLPCSLMAEDIYIIYDKDWKIEGYWKDKGDVIEKFDKDWRRDGFVRKETGEEFDSEWRRKGSIKKRDNSSKGSYLDQNQERCLINLPRKPVKKQAHVRIE